MSSKLHLVGHPPSEGAHRLACWLLGTRNPRLTAVRIDEMRRALGEITLDRVLQGELVPGQIMGAQLARLTGGRVQARQFMRPTGRRWSDVPGWDARHPEFR